MFEYTIEFTYDSAHYSMPVTVKADSEDEALAKAKKAVRWYELSKFETVSVREL